MRTLTIGTIVFAVSVTGLLSVSAGNAYAGKNGPLTPELAAKREMVRKQQAQRITSEKRRTAAEALKAERLKIYNARQAAKGSPPAVAPDTK
jgi:hypothetical protein